MGSDESKILRFPIERRERTALELIAQTAPSRSLVNTLISERGETPHDAQAGFACEFLYQVRALELGCGRDQAIVRLRVLVDAHITHALDFCRDFQDTADRLICLEVRAARAQTISAALRRRLNMARRELGGRAIAARVAADAALGTAAALATYIRDGLGALPISAEEPRQLMLFAQAVG